jgi:hypothetical protein
MVENMSCGIVQTTQSSNVLRLALYMNDRVTGDHSNFPLLALVRMLMYSLRGSSSSAIIGSVGIECVSPDEQGLGYELGVQFTHSIVDVFKGVRIRRECKAWFFKEYPLRLLDSINHECLIDNDSLCILTNYVGPSDICDILDGLNEESSDFEIAARLLKYCDTVILPLDDGEVFGAYIKTESLELTNPS